MDKYISVAADSIAQLRRVDVFRVLESNSAEIRLPLAKFIADKRPDLLAEVDAVMLEEFGVADWAVAAAQVVHERDKPSSESHGLQLHPSGGGCTAYQEKIMHSSNMEKKIADFALEMASAKQQGLEILPSVDGPYLFNPLTDEVIGRRGSEEYNRMLFGQKPQMDVAIANTRETKRLFSKGDVDGAFAHYMQDPFGGKNPEFAQTTKDEFVFSMQCQAGGPKAALYLTQLERQAWCEAGVDDAAIEMIADAGGFDSIRVDGRKLSRYQDLLHGPLNSRIYGIWHELKKLGWESDHDAPLRKVIDGVELQAKLVRSFINAGKLVSDFKFDVIDVSGVVHVTSVVDNDMKKSMSAMAQAVDGVACELSAKAKTPMAQANKIAGEKAEIWYADESVGGTYSGKVMGLSAEHVVLSLGRVALVVWQSRIDQVPAKGDDVTIAFKGGRGVVSFNRAVEKSGNER